MISILLHLEFICIPVHVFWSCCIMNSLVCILGNRNVDQIVSIFLALLFIDTYILPLQPKQPWVEENDNYSLLF